MHDVFRLTPTPRGTPFDVMSQSKNVVHLRGSRDALFVGFKIDGKCRALAGVAGCVLARDPELGGNVVHLRGSRDALFVGFEIDGKRRALAGVTGCVLARDPQLGGTRVCD